jgi:hypothetical protein
MKFRVFWDVLLCSQVDVDIYVTTWQYIPEDSKLHTRRCENLKSHKQWLVLYCETSIQIKRIYYVAIQ